MTVVLTGTPYLVMPRFLSKRILGAPTPRIRWQQLVPVGTNLGRRSEEGDEGFVVPRAKNAVILCNTTANITKNCDQWTNIPNATSPNFDTPRATASINGTQVRFLATNQNGTFISPTITIILGSAPSSGDGVDTGVIVGPIVGVGGFLLICCLCSLFLLLVLFLLILRSRRGHGYVIIRLKHFLTSVFKCKIPE